MENSILLTRDIGSLGDKFYIILQGTVSVQVPNDQYKLKIDELITEELMRQY